MWTNTANHTKIDPTIQENFIRLDESMRVVEREKEVARQLEERWGRFMGLRILGGMRLWCKVRQFLFKKWMDFQKSVEPVIYRYRIIMEPERIPLVDPRFGPSETIVSRVRFIDSDVPPESMVKALPKPGEKFQHTDGNTYPVIKVDFWTLKFEEHVGTNWVMDKIVAYNDGLVEGGVGRWVLVKTQEKHWPTFQEDREKL